jgi:hypothetical protein
LGLFFTVGVINLHADGCFLGRGLEIFAADCQHCLFIFDEIFAPGEAAEAVVVDGEGVIEAPLFGFGGVWGDEDPESAVAAGNGEAEAVRLAGDELDVFDGFVF